MGERHALRTGNPTDYLPWWLQGAEKAYDSVGASLELIGKDSVTTSSGTEGTMQQKGLGRPKQGLVWLPGKILEGQVW